ncbi:hypothetical protein [Fontivita pretiosa]|uniref:hypothetical protein n=1 Tax=Fontivita pretiosa TaxID=2989684 RepID=UPI003D175552
MCTASVTPPHSPPRWRAIAPAVFGLLTLAMFLDVLFSPSRVISFESTDLALQFIPWRHFGFTQLRAGNLALWNPHIFGGAPYFAGFQSALLYPPNWLHLLVPLSVAINWIVAMHVFLAGYFTYLWCRGRGVRIGGSILGGAMFMFSGPYFLHAYAGHLPHLAVMVWTPLMLLTLDKLAERGQWRWCMLGVIAVAMQLLAGHPQYVYYTGLALVLYTFIRLAQPGHRRQLAMGLMAMYAGGVMLSAVQVFAGIHAAGESVRAGGTDYAFASMFSLPPQNLITFLVPGFFGWVPLDRSAPPTVPYWGAGYLWEMSLFVSVAGLALATLGAIRGERRAVIALVAMIAITLILALGRHTPLYRPLFELLPGYGSFRGTTKFGYLSVLFIAMLAAMGFDSLLRQRRVAWQVLVGVATFVIALTVLGFAIDRTQVWDDFVGWVLKSSAAAREKYIPIEPGETDFNYYAATNAARWTFVAAASLAAAGVMLWLSRLHRMAPYGLLILAIGELFVFARLTRATMDPRLGYEVPAPWRAALEQVEPPERVLTVPVEYANVGMAVGFHNLAGYDPGVLKRYAELIFASQGENPDRATQYLPFRRVHPGLFRMLRCVLVCFDADRPPVRVAGEPLPLAWLVSNWSVLTSRDQILSRLLGEGFDPRRTVVLERPPDLESSGQSVPSSISPAGWSAERETGSVTVHHQTTDSIELELETSQPAVLVVGLNYSTGWRVRPVQSPQRSFSVIPANYTQLGIPLQPGRHRLIVEYRPVPFLAGAWVSGVSMVGYAGAGFLLMHRRRRFR